MVKDCGSRLLGSWYCDLVQQLWPSVNLIWVRSISFILISFPCWLYKFWFFLLLSCSSFTFWVRNLFIYVCFSNLHFYSILDFLFIVWQEKRDNVFKHLCLALISPLLGSKSTASYMTFVVCFSLHVKFRTICHPCFDYDTNFAKILFNDDSLSSNFGSKMVEPSVISNEIYICAWLSQVSSSPSRWHPPYCRSEKCCEANCHIPLCDTSPSICCLSLFRTSMISYLISNSTFLSFMSYMCL